MKKRFYILLLISFLLSLADVQAQQKATPKAGEGISTFLLRTTVLQRNIMMILWN